MHAVHQVCSRCCRRASEIAPSLPTPRPGPAHPGGPAWPFAVGLMVASCLQTDAPARPPCRSPGEQALQVQVWDPGSGVGPTAADDCTLGCVSVELSRLCDGQTHELDLELSCSTGIGAGEGGEGAHPGSGASGDGQGPADTSAGGSTGGSGEQQPGEPCGSVQLRCRFFSFEEALAQGAAADSEMGPPVVGTPGQVSPARRTALTRSVTAVPECGQPAGLVRLRRKEAQLQSCPRPMSAPPAAAAAVCAVVGHLRCMASLQAWWQAVRERMCKRRDSILPQRGCLHVVLSADPAGG